MHVYLCREMSFQVFDHARVRQLLTIALLSGTLLCIFPPQQPAFQWWADQAFFIALGYLLFGLFFLIIDKPRLMFVCFGCSAAISFFKNEAPQQSGAPLHSMYLLIEEHRPYCSGAEDVHISYKIILPVKPLPLPEVKGRDYEAPGSECMSSLHITHVIARYEFSETGS
ncbi:MAG TPA: hypothetical protein PLO67_10980 [Saprospiraceae bacterium]|nr:hypothetical protein [Saprospiraceae bacterium]HPI06480.1 hypothetical protein [Saprospiraceae bacterium]